MLLTRRLLPFATLRPSVSSTSLGTAAAVATYRTMSRKKAPATGESSPPGGGVDLSTLLIRPTKDGGLLINVRLQPNASRDSVGEIGPGDDGTLTLSAAVTAAPDKGKANAALCLLISDTLRVPKTSVSLAAGHTSRNKVVRIESSMLPDRPTAPTESKKKASSSGGAGKKGSGKDVVPTFSPEELELCQRLEKLLR
ncbi:hypothetical protein H696_03493 [Fonticula alba]|uniref:Uncharacterized protein n=1 Tax=Fonticula alba TaxID=691883 RepID=A0A058Z949_FONAL|nr:hypothetical protein H696_03493 [Fonticula alba]KCV70027.1 hypothetical protein H696_03493 [Fonticula alba]|eukprot:XP_009495633.1 hypothetical protein H696_03493 [Fonticula alba]